MNLRAIFRIILFLIFFEIFLNVGGYLFLTAQNLMNTSLDNTASGKKNYTILCMGDSMTAFGNENSYPKLLEDILNASNTDKHFKVINKGVPVRTSANIVSYLRMNIEEYKPNIVIVMMGADDLEYTDRTDNSWKEKIKITLLEKFKIFRFMKRLLDPLRPDLNKRLAHDTKGLALGDESTATTTQAAPSVLASNQSLGRKKLTIDDPDANRRYEQLIHLDPLTVLSFNDFAEITLSMGKKLIITQYPLMSIQPIQDILKSNNNIIFVENKTNFEQAIKQSNREDYFNDLIAPVFGHCSRKGNELIAQNLATAIRTVIKSQNSG